MKHSNSFPVKKYRENAKQMAIQHREQVIRLIPNDIEAFQL